VGQPERRNAVVNSLLAKRDGVKSTVHTLHVSSIEEISDIEQNCGAQTKHTHALLQESLHVITEKEHCGIGGVDGRDSIGLDTVKDPAKNHTIMQDSLQRFLSRHTFIEDLSEPNTNLLTFQ